MIELDELLTYFNLDKMGKQVDDKYVIELEDSDDFANAYTLFDNETKTNYLYQDDEYLVSTPDKSTIVYFTTDNDFSIELDGDFEKDIYTITIEESKRKE